MEMKDEERMAMIPLIVHELDVARYLKIIKWLVAVIIILIGVLAYNFFGYDYADITIDSRDKGNANYLEAGANGVINNASDSSTQKDKKE
jgi:hypothetical protein